MRNFFWLLLIVFTIPALGQTEHKGLVLHRTLSNFGEVEFWQSRVDTFLMTNTTNETIYILKQKYPRTFEVRIPRYGIAPGETGIVEVIYKPNEIGPFKEKLQFYHSASGKPFFLNFEGEIKAFDAYAQMACPSFSTPNYQKPNFTMEILVIDSLTQQPIPGAFIELSKGEYFVQYTTDSKGQLTRQSHLGLFFIYTSSKGYRTKTVEHYFNPAKNSITITLFPIEPEFIEEPNNEIIVIKKPVPIPEPQDTLIAKVEIPNRNIDLPEESESLKNEPFNLATWNPVEQKGEFNLADYKENNLVFLIDVSASMRGDDRLELLKTSMISLVELLRKEDRLTIITYSDEAQVILPSTRVKDKASINALIQSLKSGGSTYGGKAIKKAYKIAEENFISSGNNQIILATDGGFNGLGKSEQSLIRLVQRKADKHVYCSVLAFGKNKRGKELLEALALNGRGNYLYIQSEDEARKVLNYTIMQQSKVH